MDEKELRAEVRKLRRVITTAAKEAEAYARLIDKLTAAQLQVELLMKQLRRGTRRRGQ